MFKCIAKYIDQVYLIEWYSGRLRVHRKQIIELEARLEFQNEEYNHLSRHMFTLQRRCVKMGVDPNPDSDINPDLGGEHLVPKAGNTFAPGAGPKDNVVFLEGSGHD